MYYLLCRDACQFLRGFWDRGSVCGDQSVFVTSHRPAHSSRAHAFSPDRFCISHLKCFLYLPTFRPFAPPCLWIWSLPKFWTNSLFPKRSGQNSLIRHASRSGNLLNMSMMSRTGLVFSPVLNHQSWTACTLLQLDVHTKQLVPEMPSFSPGVATIQVKIWTHQSNQTGGAH